MKKDIKRNKNKFQRTIFKVICFVFIISTIINCKRNENFSEEYIESINSSEFSDSDNKKYTEDELKSFILKMDDSEISLLAKKCISSKKLMGTDFYNYIIKCETTLKSKPDKYDKAVHSINLMIDELKYLNKLPDNLKEAMKLEIKKKMDIAVKSNTTK